ncbi:hypothetical protein ACGFX7_26970 [Streptomyces harbinensis]|uniref:hypothetical protein n=1 Tax=Streptomyces harbinensis TaxID=1176198 RepID=UPI00371ED301
MGFQGIFRKTVTDPEPFADRTDAQLDAEIDKWGRFARQHATDETPSSAQFAREAREAAQAEKRRRRG